MTREWLPTTRKGEESFAKPSDAWLMTDGRSDPKFVARVADEAADLLALDGKAYELLSESPFGLRVWKEPANAGGRLAVLGAICGNLEHHERAPFRKQYDQAWRELGESSEAFVLSTIQLAIEGVGGFAPLRGGEPPPKVYVRTDRDRETAKLLIDTGAALLASAGDLNAKETVRLLNETGLFEAGLVDGQSVKLFVDEKPFQTSLNFPLLVDAVPWLRKHSNARTCAFEPS
jgi:hypothetical protein